MEVRTRLLLLLLRVNTHMRSQTRTYSDSDCLANKTLLISKKNFKKTSCELIIGQYKKCYKSQQIQYTNAPRAYFE